MRSGIQVSLYTFNREAEIQMSHKFKWSKNEEPSNPFFYGKIYKSKDEKYLTMDLQGLENTERAIDNYMRFDELDDAVDYLNNKMKDFIVLYE
jgi:hypothetical protein